MGHKKLVSADPSNEYPDFLRALKTKKPKESISNHPKVVIMNRKRADEELQSLLANLSSTEIVDNYAEQYAELLLSRNAHLYRANYEVQVASIKDLLKKHYGKKQAWRMGSWAFFPWRNQLVHILAQTDFEELRTIRNRELITAQEQQKLFDFNVASVGMSVGSAGALGLAITGISRNIKLVDEAVISGSNLNRILTGVTNVGQGKANVIGRQIYEMNPYSRIEYIDKATKGNIADIFDKPFQVDLAVDEIDDIEMKVRLRYEARRRNLPVVMATELGDTVMLDVERFDQEPNRPLFHGLVPGIEQLLKKPLTNYREWTKHAVGIINPINMPLKMQQSVLKIGSTIVTHPQLGSTVMITGGVLAFAVKNIALQNPLNSGRYVISLEKLMLADHQTREYKRHHIKHTRIIRSAVDSM